MIVLHLLEREFRRRERSNSRYSLRAFAQWLDVDHSTLSQWLRRTRPLTARTIEHVGWRLGLLPRQLRASFRDVPLDRISRGILDAIADPSFVADTPSLAARLHVSPDAVNVALQRLIRRGLLQMDADRRWRHTP